MQRVTGRINHVGWDDAHRAHEVHVAVTKEDVHKVAAGRAVGEEVALHPADADPVADYVRRLQLAHERAAAAAGVAPFEIFQNWDGLHWQCTVSSGDRSGTFSRSRCPVLALDALRERLEGKREKPEPCSHEQAVWREARGDRPAGWWHSWQTRHFGGAGEICIECGEPLPPQPVGEMDELECGHEVYHLTEELQEDPDPHYPTVEMTGYDIPGFSARVCLAEGEWCICSGSSSIEAVRSLVECLRERVRVAREAASDD